MVDHLQDVTTGHPEALPPRVRARAQARWGGLPLRICLRGCRIIAGFAILLIVAAGLFVARLTHGPIVLDGVGPRIAAALDARFGNGFAFTVGETAITQEGYGPTLALSGLSVTGDDGQILLSAPRAEVSIDPFALIFGKVSPRRLELFDLELHFVMQPDGSVAVSAGPGGRPAVAAAPFPAATAGAPAPPGKPVRPVEIKQASAAIRLLIDSLTNPASPMAAVDRIGISGGRLIVEDPTTDQRSVFDGLDLSFDKSSGLSTFHLAATGPSRRWSADATADGTPTTDRHLHIQAKDLSLDEIALAAGTRSLGADFDMPVATQIDIALTPQGTLSEAAGSVDFGSGYLRFDDPDSEPLMIDHAGATLHWEAASRRIVVDEAAMQMGGTHFTIAGALTPPVNEGDPWQIDLANRGACAFGPERPNERPIPIDAFAVSASLDKGAKRLVLDRFAISGPDAGLKMTGLLDWKSGPHLVLDAALDPTPARTVIRVWPSFLAAQVRGWFLSHFNGGTVQSGHLHVDLEAEALAAMRADRPPPDAAVAIDFAFTDARVDFLAGVPPLAGMEGTGHITGRTSTLSVGSAFLDTGGGRRLLLSEGTFHVPDGGIKPTPATIVAHVTGPVEAVAWMLGRDAIKPYASMPLDAATVKGQTDAHLGIDLKLGANAGPDDLGLHVTGTLTNVVVDKLIGKEKFEGGTIVITGDTSGVKATGQGRMFGAPAQLEINRPAYKPGEAAISITLDEAARAKQGFGNISGLSGPVSAHISIPLGGTDKPKAQIDLDLTKTALDGVLPGLYKPAGRPGKASFAASVGDSVTTLDQIVVDMGSIQARGAVDLGPDQSLVAARFPQLKFSPGDDMHLEASKSGDALKLTIRGSSIDARPFLKPFTFASGEAKTVVPGSSSAALKDAPLFKDVELDLKTALLSGYNKQLLSNVELRLAKHGDQLRQFSIIGHFGREPITGTLTGGGGPGAPQLEMTTSDAGALLGFVDLYRHMDGGHLAVNMRLGEGGLAGGLDIKDFMLRDEPALRRLVAEARPPRTGSEENSAAPIQTIDANAVYFNRLQVRFQRVGDRLDLHDGVMYGPALGLSVDGQLDFAHDHVNMNGTYVPAYAVNNLFSQIPLFGLLLGGGSHEGLFAVNYRVTGLASAPTLSINPLSAIAPGFLRKIFGAIDATAPQPGGAIVPAQPAAAQGP